MTELMFSICPCVMDVLGKLLNTRNARFILSYAYQPPMYMLDSTNQHANHEPKLLLIFSPTKHHLWLTKKRMARWRNTKGKQNFDLFSCLSVNFKAATVNRRRFKPRILLILYQSLTKNIILWIWKRSTHYSYGAFIL